MAALCINYMHSTPPRPAHTHNTRVCCHSQISSRPTDIQHSQLWSLVSAILCSARRSSCLYSHVNLMRWLTGLDQKSPNLFDFKLTPATVYRWIFIYLFFLNYYYPPTSPPRPLPPGGKMSSFLRWVTFLKQG